MEQDLGFFSGQAKVRIISELHIFYVLLCYLETMHAVVQLIVCETFNLIKYRV